MAPSRHARRADGAPRLLAGGNPQIPKGDGEAPVRAYIAAMPGWKREVGRRVDALVGRLVPDVCRAVRWNAPFYGVRDGGWFLSMRCFTHCVQLAFLNGAVLQPPPPKAARHARVRYLDLPEGAPELDGEQLERWIREAARLPGEDLF